VVPARIDVVMNSHVVARRDGRWFQLVRSAEAPRGADQPAWRSHDNASVLKVNLATTIIGISSIHPRRTFINGQDRSEELPFVQTAIHITSLLSAMALAFTDRLMLGPGRPREKGADAH